MLKLTTAGESHGPALVGIVTGLPAGLSLDRQAIDADLRRRQQGYGRSPRQQLEQDEVEVLAGLRHGRTLGTPLALVVRNRDHKNWAWGMSAWPPEGEAAGKGTKPVTLPRPGHADLAGSLKYGLADARDALERASARQTAVAVAAGAVAKALLAEIGIDVLGRVVTEALEQRIDEARAERDTVGGVVEVRAHGIPPGLGSYATKEERLDARLAAALMGIQAVKGAEIGAGFELAERRGSDAHDEILADADGTLYRETNPAAGRSRSGSAGASSTSTRSWPARHGNRSPSCSRSGVRRSSACWRPKPPSRHSRTSGPPCSPSAAAPSRRRRSGEPCAITR